MPAIRYLKHLHDDCELPWPQIVKLLEDPEENSWRLARKYRITPRQALSARLLCRRANPTVTEETRIFLQSVIHFEQQQKQDAA